MIRKATCCCGDCTIEVEGEPLFNAVCHCTSYKKRTGSAFGWSAYFPDERISAPTGEFKPYDGTGEIPVRRWFCVRCGTTVYWKSTAFMPGQTGFAAGCFADDPLGEPSLSANDPNRCAWLDLPKTWLGVSA